jgi:muramoyltetrapeptide carboxypeptidase
MAAMPSPFLGTGLLFAPLRPGDAVAVVAPAGAVDAARFYAGCEALRRAGHPPVYLDSILERDLYFAGPVERRARELEEMYRRDEVRAILCARGGYGCNYLLPELDFELIRAHPKPFIGHSDITSLLTCLADLGLPALHGPMLLKDFTEEQGVDAAAWQAATTGSAFTASSPGAVALAEGSAEGVLYGGCLSILAASLGTPWECRIEGKLLFLEDINAKPFQVDRMLMQLKLAGKLEGVRGFVFGEMVECGDQALLRELIPRVLGGLGVPIAYGLRSGHVSAGNITLPLGVPARLEVRGGRVELHITGAATAAAGERGIGEQAGKRR